MSDYSNFGGVPSSGAFLHLLSQLRRLQWDVEVPERRPHASRACHCNGCEAWDYEVDRVDAETRPGAWGR